MFWLFWPQGLWDLRSPTRDGTQHPLHWKNGVLSPVKVFIFHGTVTVALFLSPNRCLSSVVKYYIRSLLQA